MVFTTPDNKSGDVIIQKQASNQIEQQDSTIAEKPALIVESLKEDQIAGWPSFGRLISDLFKFGIEAIGTLLLNLIPLRRGRAKAGRAPLKDSLVMPEDKAEPPLVQKQKGPSPMSEPLHAPNVIGDSPPKPQKSNKPPKFKDPSSKHRSSKRQDFAEFYGSGESPQLSSKSQKDRVRYRHRDKTGEVFGTVGPEPKSVEMKSADYGEPKFDHYNIRSKYGSDNAYRY